MARILLVDDEEPVLDSIELLLRGEGHKVVPCQEAGDAVALLGKEPFDLLITDIVMAPIDGMELLEQAVAIRPQMPLIVISAYTSEAAVERSKTLGCTAYIRKPFRIQEVLDTVRTALAEGRKVPGTTQD